MFEKIKKYFKDNFSKKEVKQRAMSVVPDVMDKPKSALDLARERILNERIKNAHKKAEELSVGYTARLNEYLHTYFANFAAEPAENEFAYTLLDKEWKQYCQKANSIQKYVTLRANAFEVEVARIVKENPQFQTKPETV